MNDIDVQLPVVIVAAMVISIGVLSLPLLVDGFDPIPWLTLIIGATVGFIITIIVNHRSAKILVFLEKSETERRRIALTAIKNSVHELNNSVELYFTTLKHNDSMATPEKKSLLKIFFPRFRSILSLIQSSTSTLADAIDDEMTENIESSLTLLNDLFVILEFGNDVQFENNITKLQEYSNSLNTILNEVS